MNPVCTECGEQFNPKRAALGYKTCIDCGSEKLTFTVAPAFNKGAYQVITREQVKYIGR